MIVKFKSIKNWQNHIYYLFDEVKHQDQEIIGSYFYKNFNLNQEIIDSYHFGNNGRRSRMLSVVVSFKKNTTKIEAQSQFKRVYLEFYSYVNQTYALGLNIDELKELVKEIPFVYHGKESNPHYHSFLNRIIFSKKENKYISIDFSKKIFVNKFRQLAGWNIQNDSKNSKSKDQYTHKLDQIKDQLERYKNINDKLDKYIALALKDINRGHTDKALTKLQKIKRNNK